MDTKLGCHPPMSTNGVNILVEESDSDPDVENTTSSEMQKKTPYLNFFPKSCYQNVQFKQTKGGLVEAQIVSDSSVVPDDKMVEEELTNSLPATSSPSANQSSINTTIATATIANTTGVISRSSSVVSTKSDVSVPVSETAVSKTTLASVDIPTTTAPSEYTGQATTAVNSKSSHSIVTTSSVSTSLSSDNADRPISTADDPTDDPILTDESNTKVNSTIIEVGDMNPVYQSWQELKGKISEPVSIIKTDSKIPNSGAAKVTSPYDLMEPILKPSTYSSSVFISAPSSVTDHQTFEPTTQPSAPSALLYENVVPIGNGKFTVTPSSSCDSKEKLEFPLESSPKEEETTLNRSSSAGSLVQHHHTFHSPANSRKDVQYSASLTASPEVVVHQPPNEMSKSLCLSSMGTDSKENLKINVRGSTTISRGSVKKKICLFENSTMPAGSKRLAELGIFEDKDSDNGFIV